MKREYMQLATRLGYIPGFKELETIKIYRKDVDRLYGSLAECYKVLCKSYPYLKQLPTASEYEKEIRKDELAKQYATLVSQNTFFPTVPDLQQAFGSGRHVDRTFGTMVELRAYAKAQYPDVFRGHVEVEEYVTEESLAVLRRLAKKYSRFVITTAVSGQFVHKTFLQTLEAYCRHNNAQLLVLPAHDPAHNMDNTVQYRFDPPLLNHPLVFEKLMLNDSLSISSLRVPAKQINPLTGLDRLKKQGSVVVASPKMFLKYVAVSNETPSHAIMTTGAVTLPNYKTTRGTSLRTAYLAEQDHKMGAVIVEIEDRDFFHFRQIEMEAKGGFCDLNTYYYKKSRTKVRPWLYAGDWHTMETSPVAARTTKEQAEALDVKGILLQDVSSGVSHSHWESAKYITRARRFTAGELDVLEELKAVAKDINEWVERTGCVEIVDSNHHDFLMRYLEKGEYPKEPQNSLTAHKIVVELLEKCDRFDYNALRAAMRVLKLIKHPDKVKWLDRNVDHRIGGIEVSNHGDMGPDGARGDIHGIEKSYIKSFTGHRHTPEILREAWRVGTNSIMELSYKKGPSSWVWANGLIFEEYGTRQILNTFNGSWRLQKKSKRK